MNQEITAETLAQINRNQLEQAEGLRHIEGVTAAVRTVMRIVWPQTITFGFGREFIRSSGFTEDWQIDRIMGWKE